MRKIAVIFIVIIPQLFLSMKVYCQNSGQLYIDSLQKAIKSLPSSSTLSDTARIKLLVEVSYSYHKMKPELGIKYGEEALIGSQQLKWAFGTMLAGNRLGLNYWAKSDYPKALQYHFAALKIGEENGFKEGVAAILGNIGLAYESQRNYSKALDYHLKALKINEELGNKGGIARNLGNIGIVYDAKGDFSNSITNYSKALSLYEELNDKNGIARNLGNIGFVYQQQNINSKALEYHFRALKMNEELGNTILQGMNFGNIGTTYISILKDPETGKFNQLPDSIKRKDVPTISNNYLNKAIAIFKSVDDKNSLQELYKNLSELQFVTGNYKESLLSFKQHAAFQNAIYNEENQLQIAALERSREEDLKQKQIELLESQSEVEQLTAQRRKAIIYGLGAATIILLIFTLGIFNRSKKRQILNEKLQLANTELKNTQDQLVRSEKMAAFGVMASRLAHEIQNPLNFVNNFSELSTEIINDFDEVALEPDLKASMKMLSDNMEKINLHGKRADQIVKELQQHINKGTAHEFFEEQ
ncbi:MAG: tetratricopeptide repeat protein [Bacteroidetes bacterium]|nr:tetratricopeptide repeat protein [Bacteroidota bacterium]